MRKTNKKIALLSFLVVAAVGYMAMSATSLFVAPSSVSANNAPDGTLFRYTLGHTDYVWNWDFNRKNMAQSEYASNVDWGMRFIFQNNANRNYVKDRLDGAGGDPTISPALDNPIGSKQYAHIDDGHEHVGSVWDWDKGIKNLPICQWNFGHMRIYGNSGVNYNPSLGYYVVASIHRDFEGEPLCDNMFSSRESHEDTWISRIENNLGPTTDYDWEVTDDETSWRNILNPGDDIGGGNHFYHSDGWGVVVDVPGDD